MSVHCGHEYVESMYEYERLVSKRQKQNQTFVIFCLAICMVVISALLLAL